MDIHHERHGTLFVVHVQVADDHIRIISARRATAQERKDHDF
jgi:uncharacterized DUF497 family protein